MPKSVCTALLLATRDTVEISMLIIVGDVFQDHGLQLCLVAFQEKVVLKVDNGTHSAQQRLLALLDSVDEPFGGVQLLLYERYGLLQLLILLIALVVSLEHLGIRPADAKLGRVAAVQRQLQLAVVVGQDKVGDDILILHHRWSCLLHPVWGSASR